MKKAMLFLLLLLFSVGASAAIIHIDNVYLDNATLSDDSPNDASLAVFDFEATADSGVTIWNDVTNTGGSPSKVQWTFNPDAISGTIYDYNLASVVDVTGLASYSYTFYMVSGATYFMDFNGSTLTGSTIVLSVRAVPVPAALWLLAPALTGFFGLRRKTTNLRPA